MFCKGRVCASFAVTLRLLVMLRVSTEWPLHTLDYIITKHMLLWKRAWLLIYFQNHSWMPAVALWLTSCCRVLDSCFVFACNMSGRKKIFHSLSDQRWLWASDPPALTSRFWEDECKAPHLTYVVLGTEARASRILDKHSSNWVSSFARESSRRYRTGNSVLSLLSDSTCGIDMLVKLVVVQILYGRNHFTTLKSVLKR